MKAMPTLHLSLLLALGLSACATAPMAPDDELSMRMPSNECDASGVQEAIGKRASGELGARMLAQTGSQRLRWVPPRTAVTMDFRPDRLSISYDDEYVIETIRCG